MPGPTLDVLNVKDPCTESWTGMRGDGPVRFCGACKMNVYNLSAMTPDEAETVVREREGKLCVRFYRRADGTVTTASCAPMRFMAARRAARRAMTVGAALLLTLLGIVASLGLFRLSGVDLASWLEETPIGKVAKAILPEPEPMMGALVEPEWEMGEAMVEEDVIQPDVIEQPVVE